MAASERRRDDLRYRCPDCGGGHIDSLYVDFIFDALDRVGYDHDEIDTIMMKVYRGLIWRTLYIIWYTMPDDDSSVSKSRASCFEMWTFGCVMARGSAGAGDYVVDVMGKVCRRIDDGKRR